MTTPIPDGGFSEIVPATPASPSPAGAGAAPLSDKMQVVQLLAGTALHVPNFAHLKMAHMKPMHKTLQHDVVKELITKFKPVLTELAVLALRGQQSQPRVEKPPASTPSESGTRRDEATPKGSTTLGKDLVNIEVHGGEEGGNNPNQQFQGKAGQPQTPGVKSGEKDVVKKEGNEELPPDPATASKEKGSSSTPSTPKAATPKEAESPQLKKEGGQGEKIEKAAPTPENAKEVQKASPKDAQEMAKEAPQTASKDLPSASAQIATSKAAQEAQIKPPETQPKDSSSNVAPHKTNPTKENTPDQAMGIKEVPKGEEAHVSKEKEIPKDHLKEINSENIPVQRKHEEVATLGMLLTRTHSNEPTPTAQHKMFPGVDSDPKSFVPPWLALLLPDLIKAKTARDAKGGGQKGQQQQKPHKFADILYMLLCAHLAGAATLADVFNFIQAREQWFSVTLGLKHGMPPRQLIFWLLTTLDPRFFDRTMRRWLDEVIGKIQGRSRLLDIFLCQTPLGYLLGQTRRSEGNFKTDELVTFAEGFAWKNSVLLTKSDCEYGSLFAKLRHQKGHYLAEVENALTPPEDFEEYESYLEGQERILVQEWRPEGQTETQMKVLCEIIDSQGAISRSEHFLTSSLESPAGYYFDLFRLQRNEEAKCAWLINAALSFPSMEETLDSCTATLNNLQEYANELISTKCESSDPATIKAEMEKAAGNNDYLLELAKANGKKLFG